MSSSKAENRARQILGGCRQYRVAKSTKSVVGIFAAAEAGFDEMSERWIVSCEAHATNLGCRTLQLARRHAVTPEEWCEECRAQLTRGGKS